MNLYDDLAKDILDKVKDGKSLSFEDSDWNQIKDLEIIFKNDTVFELGEDLLFGLSGILYSSDDSLIDKDEVILLGDDFNNINKNKNYARIVLINYDDSNLKSTNSLYQKLRKIDYARYHVLPEGVMIRISSLNKKESLRVSKRAIKNNLSFAHLGKQFIDAYHNIENVKFVKIIFINEDSFDYKSLEQLLIKSENITKALDHLVNKINMDCKSCSLQVVCNEVEDKLKNDFNQ